MSREGVQRDLLPIVEGSTITTKYGPVKTDHVLFIAAGTRSWSISFAASSASSSFNASGTFALRLRVRD